MSENSTKDHLFFTDSKSVVVFIAGLMIGGSIFYLGPNFAMGSGDQVAQDLISTLEQSSGQELELINVDERNGLYRAQIRNQDDELTTYYMTKNGKMIAQESGLTNFSEFNNTVSAQADFSQCLEDRGVVMFGNQSQRSTLAQIQLLGGPNMLSNIYADVNNNQTRQQAVQLGIQTTPSFYYNDSVAQGTQTVTQLSSFTGCNFDEN